ncbi:RNA polymerase subunit sigma-70 [Roseiconus nitratireducens]|uniref:RNA polymerase subunit sigma-70 n=1 Tax=Roseiconus nitratireducens TaxID=2605748 RepID=A0A5M6D8T6_9BACT|nr:ECF-type sigma factor [Roseiconus nitratireducens]KAA5543036.1 RNA polymerase subunit sigma-70 [Roseiconus nitratireducens]
MHPSEGNPEDSVTAWIGDLKAGQDDATQKIWERYFARLVRVAARRMGSAPRRIADEEDVAVSVFDSLCRGAAEGRFQQLQNRDDLWKLLTAIAGMKAVDQIRRQTAQKRGGESVRGESVFEGSGDRPIRSFGDLVHGEPTADFLAVMEEQQQKMFELLPDDSQRQVATLRFEGYSNQEIAERLDISLRSVERKLKVIREIWTSALGPTEDS